MCFLLNNLLFHTFLNLRVSLSVKRDPEPRIVVPGGSMHWEYLHSKVESISKTDGARYVCQKIHIQIYKYAWIQGIIYWRQNSPTVNKVQWYYIEVQSTDECTCTCWTISQPERSKSLSTHEYTVDALLPVCYLWHVILQNISCKIKNVTKYLYVSKYVYFHRKHNPETKPFKKSL
jgi:hypothetical protein